MFFRLYIRVNAMHFEIADRLERPGNSQHHLKNHKDSFIQISIHLED